MFYGEEYNVPPCCDQKYFRFLWEHLREEATIYKYKEDLKRKLMSPMTEEEAEAFAESYLADIKAKLQKLSKEKATTSLFMLSDYSLQQVLAKVVLNVPMSEMYLLVHEVTDSLLDSIAHAMGRAWFNGKDSNSHILEKLNLLVPSSADKELIRAYLSKFGERVTLAELDSPSTIISIKNTTDHYVFTGTASQVTGQEAPALTSLVATRDPRICKETETVLRINVNSAKRKGIKL